MDPLINLYASLTGLWDKFAVWLPKIGGVGSVLTGVGGLLLEVSHATSAAALVELARNFKGDPNVGLILAGLVVLGLHTQQMQIHQQLKAGPKP
ncbi:MAG: hypothetical protein PHS14_00145 [Elusimicrobia bacterium]|nr:hypothetical protein [Elusimicrobiota bacterium]